MLTFHPDGALESVIGAHHGLTLEAVARQNKQKAESALTWLWDRRNDADAWLGWLNVAKATSLLDDIEAYAKSVKGQFDQLVIVGIGGSALGPVAMAEALLPSYWNERSTEQRNGFPRLYVVDNVDPDKLSALLDVLDLKKTLVNVITKSGSTPETVAGFLWLQAELEKAVGKDAVAKHLVITTDPEKGPLKELATASHWKTFPIESNIGGRFSIFSPVGLLPAALLGLDCRAMLKGVSDYEPIAQQTTYKENAPLLSALIHYTFYQQEKPLSVLMPYSAKLAYVADWYVQLWAESLGKKLDIHENVVNKGSTPIKAVGVTDQHSQVQLFNEGPYDKCITFVRVGSFQKADLTIPDAYPNLDAFSYLGGKTFERLLQAEADGTRASLTQNERPTLTITLPQVDAYHFAQLLYFLELQTAFMGYLMDINPFDQPGVELGKQLTYAALGRPGFEQLKSQLATV